jgi:hypothetical protein
VAAPDIVVFLGPSLPVDEARRILPACYLGPARCGDVLRARRLQPRVMAVIDGLFGTTPAVWHKEILVALDDGIAMYGASSMGALRAAELERFGMIGVGRIFEAYREGTASAVQVEQDGKEGLLVLGPDDGRAVAAGKVMMHIQGVKSLEAASGAFDAARQRLSKAWGRPLQPQPLPEAGLSLAFARAEQAGMFHVEMAATRETRDDPEWLLPDDFRDAVATTVDGGAAVRFQRKDEVRVVRRADGMPDLWVLDRPADHARAELRRVEAARSRDAWAAALSAALRLDPTGAEPTTMLDMVQSKGGRWDVECLRAAFKALDASWPEWRGEASRRSAVEAELRAAWKEARQILGLSQESSADERDALEAALREGLAAPPTPAPSK